jgi:hypothetical protein
MGSAVWGSAGLMFIVHQNKFLADFSILEADSARKTGLCGSGPANCHIRGKFAVGQLEYFVKSWRSSALI